MSYLHGDAPYTEAEPATIGYVLGFLTVPVLFIFGTVAALEYDVITGKWVKVAWLWLGMTGGVTWQVLAEDPHINAYFYQRGEQ